MAFGLPNTSPTNSGPFLGRIQYDSTKGLWTIVHRVQDSDGRWTDEEDNPFRKPLPRFLADFGSLEVGFIKYYPKPPEFRTVPYGETLPQAPNEMGTDQSGKTSKLFKSGFRVKVASSKLFGDSQAYWFSHTALCVLEPFDAVYETFLASPEAATGKVPMILCTSITENKVNDRKIYAPSFAIDGWMDRIEAFGERTVPAPSRRSMGVTLSPSKPAPVAAKPAPVQTEPPPNDDEWGDAPTQERTKVPLPAGDIDSDIPF